MSRTRKPKKTKKIKFTDFLIGSMIITAMISFIFCMVFVFKIDYNKCMLSLNISLGSLLLYFIFITIFPDSSAQKTIESEKRILKVPNYDNLIKKMSNVLINNDYQKNCVNANFEVYALIKRKFSSKSFHFIVISKFKELTNNEFSSMEKDIDNFIKEFMIINGNPNYVTITSIICVEERNKFFDKYVNSNICQDIMLFRFPVGISFKDNKIYMAKQKGGIYYNQYKKLRKEFLDFFETEIMKEKE